MQTLSYAPAGLQLANPDTRKRGVERLNHPHKSHTRFMPPAFPGGSRAWVTSLRIVRRRGKYRYVLIFTNGRLFASVLGSVDLDTTHSLSPTEAAWQAAAEWLRHVNVKQSIRTTREGRPIAA